MAGLVEFFYNIIPGGLFILALRITPDLEQLTPHLKNIDSFNLLVGTIFVILALFLGFVFQMANQVLFKDELKKIAVNKITHDKNKKENYERAKQIISNITQTAQNFGAGNELEAFYFMHNFLWAHKQNGLVELFNARVSLWANSLVASIVYGYLLLFFIFYRQKDINTYSIYLLGSALIASGGLYFTKLSLEKFYDAVLKTFIMAQKDKAKNSMVEN